MTPANPTADQPFRQVLKHAGLRVTQVRLSVLRVLADSPTAVAATEVAARVKSGIGADRVTVYRTLASFVKRSLAHRIDPGDRLYRYSLTDHARCEGEHHDHAHPHLVCDSCGEVSCLEGAEVVVQPRAGRAGQSARARRAPIKVRSEEVTLHGTCDVCQVRPRAQSRR